MGRNNLSIHRIDLLEELLVKAMRAQERSDREDFATVRDPEDRTRWWCKYCGRGMKTPHHVCSCPEAQGIGRRTVEYVGQIGSQAGDVRMIWPGLGCVIEVTGLRDGQPDKRTFVISIDEINNLTERDEPNE